MSTTGNVLGFGDHRYTAVPEWDQLPTGWSFLEATSVATNSRGEVFVFNRGGRPMIVLDRDGAVINCWEGAEFVRPHGITIGPQDEIYCVDDVDHTIAKFTPDGELQWRLGTSGQPSATGAIGSDYRTIKQAGPPFNYPCNLAIAPNGDLFICDGYGNARVHRYSAGGEHVASWGEPGDGPGQFHLPHGIAIDREGIVYVADRENSRVQRFRPDGEFVDEWGEIARPCGIYIDEAQHVYVAEVGYRMGMWSGQEPPTPDASGGRVSIFDLSGNLLSRWGGGENPMSPEDLCAPHDICVDDRGDVYVAEVTWSAAGKVGKVSPICPTLRKFARVRDETAGDPA
jgi:DNA-binding beta-propeller fold protein YncE